MGLEQRASDVDTQGNLSTVDLRVPPPVPLLLWRCNANSNRRLAGSEAVKCMRLISVEMISRSVALALLCMLPGSALFWLLSAATFAELVIA